MERMADLVTGDRVARFGELRLGCSAAIFDEARQRMLLLQRDDNQLWCLPSGGMDPGESVTETIVREVEEETGLVVGVVGLVGVYSSPHVLVRYADGNRFQIVSLCFAAEILAGELRTTSEAVSVGYFTPEEAAGMDIMANHVERIRDAFDYEGFPFIR
jgi:ADP-ribose pyrophosphatase YjhB (NUDIX family)